MKNQVAERVLEGEYIPKMDMSSGVLFVIDSISDMKPDIEVKKNPDRKKLKKRK